MKVVLNRDYGGFGLSNKAFERLIELGFPFVHEKDSDKEDYGKTDLKIIVFDEPVFNSRYGILQNDFEDEDLRSHLSVVQVVEELGRSAWGGAAKLELVEISDDIDWRIDQKNGFEWIIDWDTGLKVFEKTVRLKKE